VFSSVISVTYSLGLRGAPCPRPLNAIVCDSLLLRTPTLTRTRLFPAPPSKKMPSLSASQQREQAALLPSATVSASTASQALKTSSRGQTSLHPSSTSSSAVPAGLSTSTTAPQPAGQFAFLCSEVVMCPYLRMCVLAQCRAEASAKPGDRPDESCADQAHDEMGADSRHRRPVLISPTPPHRGASSPGGGGSTGGRPLRLRPLARAAGPSPPRPTRQCPGEPRELPAAQTV
jgi:hypothetical protein